MRIGLVLGAGGVQGGAWLTGGLDALATETGWDPADAEIIVGTSAGSMLAALLAGGVPPWFMVAHSAGETFESITDASGRPAAEANRSGGAVFELDPWPPPIGPGSWSLALRTLARPQRFTPASVISGWLPRGSFSTEPLREQVRRVVPSGWGPHPGLWITACDYATGARVAFGRSGSPPAELADAVAASCAIPGFYRPVEICGRRYVDGGMLVEPRPAASRRPRPRDLPEPDLLPAPDPGDRPAQWGAFVFRHASGRRLGSEAKKLRIAGTPTVLVQPLEEDLQTMSRNLMSTRNRNAVIEVARATVGAQLRAPEVAELLAELPAGRPEKVTRPDLPPAEWPPLADLQPRAAT